MSCKDEVLKQLERRRGEYISGEELAELSGVSRNAVWKAVRALKADGIDVLAATNKGYMLPEHCDTLTKQGVEKYLEDGFFDVRVFDCVTSTNTVAKEYAANGAAEGVVIAAKEQSLGKGRVGRKFFAPADSGVYFTVILRPERVFEQAILLTVAAGVSVAEAIEEVGTKTAQIKWVNDVYVDGKKCCGILSEAVADMESGGIEYVVVGIGINVKEPRGGFADEIKDIAGVACEDGIEDVRNKMIAAVLNRFEYYYKNFDKQELARIYRQRSFLTGKDVVVSRSDSDRTARVLDIDDDCRLVVEYGDGTRDSLSTGEVRIKW